MEIDTSELNALAVDLVRLSGTVGAKAAAALVKTTLDIEADAKVFVPVDTGNLRNSIGHDITGDGRFGVIEAEIGPTADYGVFVEYGTSRMPPQAYMGPAFDRRVPGYVSALEQIAGDVL